jgi:transaldolase
MDMELWLDTINIDLIRDAQRFHIFTGVTTNPAILSKSSKSFDATVKELLDVQKGKLCLQVTEEKADGMIKQAEQFRKYSDRIIIKVPLVQEGIAALSQLVRNSVPTLATAIFHPNQALIAALAGADYIAPYLGRMSEGGMDPFNSVQSMVNIYNKQNIKTKILVAAIRMVDQIQRCAEMGVQAITIKDDMYQDFMEDHVMTTDWVQKFSEDWKKVIEKG